MDGGIPTFTAGRTLAARARPCFKVTKCDLESTVSRRLSSGLHHRPDIHVERFLYGDQDRRKIFHRRIPGLREHAMQAFAGLFGERGQQRFRKRLITRNALNYGLFDSLA